MEKEAGTYQVDFVIGTGDNFYSPDGVSSVTDPAWETHWANIY